MNTKTTKNQSGHPTAERAAAIKASVVAATLNAFAEKGSAFSMDEIAQLAGVSKQAIYRRWRSKIDLVVEAVESVLSSSFPESSDPHDDPVAALKELAWRHFGDDHATTHRQAIHLHVESFSNAYLHDQLILWRARFIGLYKQALAGVEAAGRRATGDIEVQAEILADLVGGGSQKIALTGLTASADQRRCFEQRWEAIMLIAIR